MNTARNIASIYPLTPLQEGILYHALKSTSPALYMGQYSCEIHGEVDRDCLQQSWQRLFEQHACLRTLFVWRGQEQPVQIVRRHVDLPWTFRDWSDLGEDEIQVRWKTLQRKDREQGFVLDKAPLARLVLVRQAANRYRFYFAYHHLLLDGWSLRLLLNQVQDLYQQIAQGSIQSSEPDGRFADYVDWLAARDWRSADSYWAEVLGGFDEPTPLPLPPPERAQAVGHAIQQINLAESEVEALTRFVRSQRLTLNALFLAAWALVIGRYAERDDVVFGTATAGRPVELAWSDSTVGLFINTLALRVRLPEDQLLGQWLQDVQARHLEAREYEHSPLVRVQRASGIGAGSPLFESLLVFQSVPENPVHNPAWSVRDEQYLEFGNYPLAVLVRPGMSCAVSVVHDAQRFSAAAVERLLGHLRQVLTAIPNHVDTPLHSIGLLTAVEKERLLGSWAGSPVQDPPRRRIGELISRHYMAKPAAAALLGDGRSVSYAELGDRVGGIATALHGMQIGNGDFGAVFLERGDDAIAAMLAIQRVGGAYVPMDPGYPMARIQALIDDLSCAADSTGSHVVVMTNAELVPRLVDSHVAILDVTRCTPPQRPADTVEPGSADSPAYVMYTSGSTGQPKGVLVSQANLVSSTLARDAFYSEEPTRFLLLSSLATDSSIAGLFWTLSSGGTLVLPRPHQEQSVDEVAALIRDAGVTHLLCLPSLYSLIVEHAPNDSLNTLRCVIVAGEACDSGLPERHHARLPGVGLYNEYGPSEATVWATGARLDLQLPGSPVPIGRPVSNTRVYVLDKNRRPMPPGIPGELYIGGSGVAEGYLGRDSLTQERFLADPFSTAPNGRVYRTGDRVRFLESGDLQFLGRVDEQIKVRGYRVEPDEIVRVIVQHPDVAEAVVVLSSVASAGGQDAGDRRCLVAFVTGIAGRTPAPAELRVFVAERLPNHMVPQYFVRLDELPKTPGGKVDKHALVSREITDGGHATEDTYVAPTTKEQQTLAAIWRDVLGVDRIGIHDDFFELGGDSLLSIRILARANQAGMELSPALFFKQPTIAAQVEASNAGGEKPVPKAARPPANKPSAREMLGDAGLAAIARQLGDAERGDDPGTG